MFAREHHSLTPAVVIDYDQNDEEVTSLGRLRSGGGGQSGLSWSQLLSSEPRLKCLNWQMKDSKDIPPSCDLFLASQSSRTQHTCCAAQPGLKVN